MNIPAKTKIKANLVAFVVLAIGLAYAMATQVLSVLQDRYSVHAIFTDAGGVFTNQEVTYRGITVGQVGNLDVVDEGVEIELKIKEGVEIPKNGIEARVMFKSAVGEQFVDLLPASDSEPYLEDGDEIPLGQTSIPVSTQALLSTLEAVLRGVPPEALRGAIDALGLGLAGQGPNLASILESTADLAELFAKRAPEVETILKQGTFVAQEILEGREDFDRAIHELVTVSETLGGNTDALERLLRGANLAADEIIALVREHRPALNELIVKLADVNDLQAEHSADLVRLFKNLPTALQRVILAFEPDTGLVRFGLVQDNENPGCSYGTPHRSAEDRSPKLPPKNAKCEQTGSATEALLGLGTNGSFDDYGSALVPGLGPLLDDGPTLPARMSDWSWTLFYLNAV